MNSDKLREALFRKPFRPVRITLDAGDPIEVRHPEGILMNESWGVILEGITPILFEPERVVSIRYLANGGRRSRK